MNTSPQAASVWHILRGSVRGASHVRSELPNQDAIKWWPQSGGDPPLVLTVADGHGSARHFRSDQGAQLAVETAVCILQEFVRSEAAAGDPSAAKRILEERLSRELIRRWSDGVEELFAAAPFSNDELTDLERRAGSATRQSVERKPVLAYGSTLLAVLVTDTFLLYVQLGDGDILTVTEDGYVDRPVPGDSRLLGNETTSLCGSNAWRDVRLRFQVAGPSTPALILVSTDGYANSFRNDDGFRQVGADILRLIREVGVSKVQESLASWLTDASSSGSGDDITLGILYRSPVGDRPPAASPDNMPFSVESKASEGTADEGLG